MAAKSCQNKNSVSPDNPGSSSSDVSMTDIPILEVDFVEHKKQRYPHCIVWTPIPLLTWLLPIIGHMGIATSRGVIRDFAGPYFVSEDSMAFGVPTKYWQLSLSKVRNGKDAWDRSVHEASEEYKTRMHNLCCDNCHSHVAYALNLMNYDQSGSWNMIKLCFLMLVHGKYVNLCAVLKTWLPFFIMLSIIFAVASLGGVFT